MATILLRPDRVGYAKDSPRIKDFLRIHVLRLDREKSICAIEIDTLASLGLYELDEKARMCLHCVHVWPRSYMDGARARINGLGMVQITSDGDLRIRCGKKYETYSS